MNKLLMTQKKDLARVEKFGVELGTALAREIGLVDNSLSNKKFNHHKRNNKRGFKGNKGRKGGLERIVISWTKVLFKIVVNY